MKKFFAAVLLSTLFTFAAKAENLITNGTFDVPDRNFDTGTPADHWSGTGWTQWGGVYRQRWAARSGNAGGYFRAWEASADAGIWQDIACTGGVYTFTAWVRHEPAASLTALQIKIEWQDSSRTGALATAFGYYNDFPGDALWHQIKVTATGTDSRIAYIRPVLYANWNISGGSISFDDAELYQGPYTGAPPRLVNRSFEFNSTNGIRGTQWAVYPDWYQAWGGEDPWEIGNYAARSGWLGLAFKGWLTYTNTFYLQVYQNINPGTGTFTFATWMRRESGF